MAYEKIANLKGPKGNGVANPRLVGDDLVLDLVDGTVVTGQVTVGNVRGNTGARGATGATGPTGPAPDMTVVVESLAAGSEPTVWKSGTNAAPTITLGIPDGEKGDQGVPGPVPQIQFSARALDAGQNPTITRVGGTDAAPAVEIGIPQGDEGPSGPAPSLIFESPQLLAPGAQPYVNVANPRPGEYRLQLGIPQGVPGTATESIRDDQVSTSSSWSSQKTQQEIADATPAWNAITGKPSTFPAAAHSHSYDSITGKPSSFTPSAHTHAYSELTGVPSTFTPATHSHSWSQVTGKPSTFTPAPHTHNASDIQGQLPESALPSTLQHRDLERRIAQGVFGTSPRGGALQHLRNSILDQSLRCVVVVVGDSMFRAQEPSLRIGAIERLAFRAGASSLPLLDSVASAPGSGMHWLQGAVGGTGAHNYLPESRFVKIADMNPNYVLHGIGASDYSAQRPLSEHKTRMRSHCARIEADTPGVVNILVHQQQRADVPSAPIPWDEYGQVLAEVAAEKPNSRVFINLNELLTPYRFGTNYADFGMVSDGTHPNDAGHKLIATMLGQKLGIPTYEPSIETYEDIFPSGGTFTSTTLLAGGTLPAVKYPRLISMNYIARGRADVNTSSANAELQVGRSTSLSLIRLSTEEHRTSYSMNRVWYCRPGWEFAYLVRMSITGSVTVGLDNDPAAHRLQLIQKAY